MRQASPWRREPMACRLDRDYVREATDDLRAMEHCPAEDMPATYEERRALAKAIGLNPWPAWRLK